MNVHGPDLSAQRGGDIARAQPRFAASCSLAVALVSTAFPALRVAAQAIDVYPDSGHVLGVQLLRPDFDRGEFSALTGTAILSGRLAIGDGGGNVFVELPFSRGSVAGEFAGSSFLIGSPKVGILLGTSDIAGPFGSVAVRIPVPESFILGDDDFAVGVGVVGDADRFDGYLPETVTLSGSLGGGTGGPDGPFARGEADVVFLLPIGNTETRQVEMIPGWAGMVGWRNRTVQVDLSFRGRVIATGEGDFGDLTWHRVTGRVGGAGEGIRPWGSILIPVQGAFLEGLQWALAAGIEVPIG